MSVHFEDEKLAKNKELSDRIKAGLEVDGAKIKEKEKHKTYFDNLPEGLTEQTVKDMSEYNNKYVLGAHVAVGELAAEVFVKDKEIDLVDANVGFFGPKDKITMTVRRSKEYNGRSPNSKDDADKDLKVTKHLVMLSEVETSGSGIKKIREAMSAEFKDRFVK